MSEGKQEEDFPDTPQGHAERISKEMEAARQNVKKWHTQAKRILAQFLDQETGDKPVITTGREDQARWNLFWADTVTKENILYGKTPKTDVSRTFADAKDQVGRVASELWQRILDQDIQRASDDFAFATWCDLKDYLTVGLGVQRFVYECDLEDVEGTPAKTKTDPETGEEKELAPEVPATQRKTREDVRTVYQHWRDLLWSPCRHWRELRWIGFGCEMMREPFVERFKDSLARMLHEQNEPPEEQEAEDEAGTEGTEEDDDTPTPDECSAAEAMLRGAPLNSDSGMDDESAVSESKKKDPWSRVYVWEIWDKERCERIHYVKGMGIILDREKDPYHLTGFFPCQRWMIDNWTTSDLIPRPSYVLVQDLYLQVNELSTRIKNLANALKTKGVYDSSNEELSRLINGANDGEMIPIKNFLMFKEGGGVQGAFQLFPLQEIAKTLMDLREERKVVVEALRELTGMGDILRGSTAGNGTPGEAQLEAKFGSVRMQAIQNELARFCSDGQEIRKELIANLFDEQTILERSNAQYTFDAEQMGLVRQAVALMKSRHQEYRVTVKPESIALDDFQAKKSEAMELLDAVGGFFQKVAPLTQAAPQAMPEMLELFEWAISRVKGGKEVEGIIQRMADKAAQAAAKAQQQPQQNPEAMAAQADMQRQQQAAQLKAQELQMKAQLDSQRLQAETQAELQRDQAEAQQHASEEQAAHGLAMQEEERRAQLKIETAKQIQALKPQPQISLRPQPGPKK